MAVSSRVVIEKSLDLEILYQRCLDVKRLDMKGYAQAMGDSVDFCIADVVSQYDAIDPEVEGVVDRINAINKQLGRGFEETLSDHALNYGEYKLLLRLATRTEDHRMSAGDLSRSLMLSSGAMTNRLDQLEKAELVRRLRDPKDRRGVQVELTDKGKAIIDGAVTEPAAKEIDVLSVLSRRELAGLNQLLRKVLTSLEADVEADAASS
jgi:DNA-binding MarR family transcriptional regulator